MPPLSPEAQNLVDEGRRFKPTASRVSPSCPSGDELLDIAAVVAGTKPAAIVDLEDGDSALGRELLAAGRSAGYEVHRAMGDLSSDDTHLIFGKPRNVAVIARVYLTTPLREFRKFAPHAMIGKALGYPDEAIKAWWDEWRQLRQRLQQMRRGAPASLILPWVGLDTLR